MIVPDFNVTVRKYPNQTHKFGYGLLGVKKVGYGRLGVKKVGIWEIESWDMVY